MRILVVTNMYPSSHSPGLGAFIEDQVKRIRRLDNIVDVFYIEGHRSKLNYLKGIIQLLFKTLMTRYDIIHAHYGLCGLVGLFRWKTPLVVTFHGSDVLVGRFQPLVSRVVAKLADEVIVVSRAMNAIIPGHVIPCGVDLGIFRSFCRSQARARLGLVDRKKYVLFPFNPERKIKRYDIAAAVIEKLKEKGYDIELLVVNDEKHENMPWYYSAADAMILCSDSEGSPTSVKEALSCNLPVICNNVGDVQEIIGNSRYSKVCNQDVKSYVDALEKIICGKKVDYVDTHDRMVVYNIATTVNRIIELYRDVIDVGRAGKGKKSKRACI